MKAMNALALGVAVATGALDVLIGQQGCDGLKLTVRSDRPDPAERFYRNMHMRPEIALKQRDVDANHFAGYSEARLHAIKIDKTFRGMSASEESRRPNILNRKTGEGVLTQGRQSLGGSRHASTFASGINAAAAETAEANDARLTAQAAATRAAATKRALPRSHQTIQRRIAEARQTDQVSLPAQQQLRLEAQYEAAEKRQTSYEKAQAKKAADEAAAEKTQRTVEWSRRRAARFNEEEAFESRREHGLDAITRERREHLKAQRVAELQAKRERLEELRASRPAQRVTGSSKLHLRDAGAVSEAFPIIKEAKPFGAMPMPALSAKSSTVSGASSLSSLNSSPGTTPPTSEAGESKEQDAK